MNKTFPGTYSLVGEGEKKQTNTYNMASLSTNLCTCVSWLTFFFFNLLI